MMDVQPDPKSQLRNIKDFLFLYNGITEHCFLKCVTDLGKTKLVESEKSCINGCANMYLQTNRRFMQQFMEHTPDMMKRKAEEMEKYAAAARSATESPTITDAAISATESPTITDAVSTTTTDINPSEIPDAKIPENIE